MFIIAALQRVWHMWCILRNAKVSGLVHVPHFELLCRSSGGQYCNHVGHVRTLHAPYSGKRCVAPSGVSLMDRRGTCSVRSAVTSRAWHGLSEPLVWQVTHTGCCDSNIAINSGTSSASRLWDSALCAIKERYTRKLAEVVMSCRGLRLKLLKRTRSLSSWVHHGRYEKDFSYAGLACRGYALLWWASFVELADSRNIAMTVQPIVSLSRLCDCPCVGMHLIHELQEDH